MRLRKVFAAAVQWFSRQLVTAGVLPLSCQRQNHWESIFSPLVRYVKGWFVSVHRRTVLVTDDTVKLRQ